MNYFYFFFLFLTLLSCANNKTQLEKRDLEQLYQGAGVERYFLPDLPIWANFSASADCKRSGPTRYLNFATLRASYSLSYEDLIHFQQMFNRRLTSFKQDNKNNQVYLKDEAFIFFNVYEQVVGGSKDFVIPKFDRISLVWIDPYLDDIEKVGKILERKDVAKGHPVLVSSCLDSASMEELAEERDWNRFGVKNISQEMFTPFETNFSLGHDYSLDFSAFLPNKALYLYAPRAPKHFKGVEQFIKI